MKDLGIMKYSTAFTLQEQIAEEVYQGYTQETVLLLEHYPVYTIGRGGHITNILDQSIEAIRISRAAYPNRTRHSDFIQRFLLLLNHDQVSTIPLPSHNNNHAPSPGGLHRQQAEVRMMMVVVVVVVVVVVMDDYYDKDVHGDDGFVVVVMMTVVVIFVIATLLTIMMMMMAGVSSYADGAGESQ